MVKKIRNHGFINRNFGKKVVHVEMAYLPEIQGKLIKHLRKYRSKCYCICPSNYDLVNVSFGISLSRKEYYDILKEFYLKLKNRGINLQLHVHLSMFPKNLPLSKKENLLKSAYNFFVKELKIKPKEIVFGWYASDKESIEIVKKLGLKIINEHLHIYDWWLK